jgi:hypothetical protein
MPAMVADSKDGERGQEVDSEDASEVERDTGGGDCDCDDGEDGRLGLEDVSRASSAAVLPDADILAPKPIKKTWRRKIVGCGGSGFTQQDRNRANRGLLLCAGTLAAGGRLADRQFFFFALTCRIKNPTSDYTATSGGSINAAVKPQPEGQQHVFITPGDMRGDCERGLRKRRWPR